jgi:hypothetical protein
MPPALVQRKASNPDAERRRRPAFRAPLWAGAEVVAAGGAVSGAPSGASPDELDRFHEWQTGEEARRHPEREEDEEVIPALVSGSIDRVLVAPADAGERVCRTLGPRYHAAAVGLSAGGLAVERPRRMRVRNRILFPPLHPDSPRLGKDRVAHLPGAVRNALVRAVAPHPLSTRRDA